MNSRISLTLPGNCAVSGGAIAVGKKLPPLISEHWPNMIRSTISRLRKEVRCSCSALLHSDVGFENGRVRFEIELGPGCPFCLPPEVLKERLMEVLSPPSTHAGQSRIKREAAHPAPEPPDEVLDHAGEDDEVRAPENPIPAMPYHQSSAVAGQEESEEADHTAPLQATAYIPPSGDQLCATSVSLDSGLPAMDSGQGTQADGEDSSTDISELGKSIHAAPSPATAAIPPSPDQLREASVSLDSGLDSGQGTHADGEGRPAGINEFDKAIHAAPSQATADIPPSRDQLREASVSLDPSLPAMDSGQGTQAKDSPTGISEFDKAMLTETPSARTNGKSHVESEAGVDQDQLPRASAPSSYGGEVSEEELDRSEVLSAHEAVEPHQRSAAPEKLTLTPMQPRNAERVTEVIASVVPAQFMLIKKNLYVVAKKGEEKPFKEGDDLSQSIANSWPSKVVLGYLTDYRDESEDPEAEED